MNTKHLIGMGIVNWVLACFTVLFTILTMINVRETKSFLAEAKLRNDRTRESLRKSSERFEAASKFQRPAKAIRIESESSVLQLWILDSDGQILRYDEWCSKNNRFNDGFFRGDHPSVYSSGRPSKEAFENW